MRAINELTGIVVDEAYRLHVRLGPGLLENVYETLLARLLERRGVAVERQKLASFELDGIRFVDAFRVDLLVEETVVVELKAVERLLPVHSKQLLSYLRLMNLPVGLLINFGEARLADGVHRIVNRYEPPRDADPLCASRFSSAAPRDLLTDDTPARELARCRSGGQYSRFPHPGAHAWPDAWKSSAASASG